MDIRETPKANAVGIQIYIVSVFIGIVHLLIRLLVPAFANLSCLLGTGSYQLSPVSIASMRVNQEFKLQSIFSNVALMRVHSRIV